VADLVVVENIIVIDQEFDSSLFLFNQTVLFLLSFFLSFFLSYPDDLQLVTELS